MKTKISALALIRCLIFGAVFSLCFTACFDWSEPNVIFINSLKDAEEKLAVHTFNGAKPEDPVQLIVRKMNIGDMSQPDNDYLRLIEIIGNSGLYAELSLGEAIMGGKTVFTSPPLNEAVKGMEKIVVIDLPYIATSIKTDKNGRSPFFFYENLKRVSGGDTKITEIGDNAFSFCKSLEQVNLYDVKTVGREAFQGCENLKRVTLTLSETIGDRAFLNCESLLQVSMYRKPPTLGDSVFLGNTPSTFTLSIEKAHEVLYRSWLNENALKFNNYGVGIAFKLN